MPQMFPPYGDNTYDALQKKTASSMKYEYCMLAPALSFLHDAITHVKESVDGLRGEYFSAEDLLERQERLENTLNGVYSLLCNRYTVLQLRARIDVEGAATSKTDSLRAKFVEDCVYQRTEALVIDDLLKEYIDEFDRGKIKARMYASMKPAACSETGYEGGRGGDRGPGRYEDAKGEKGGASGKGNKGSEEEERGGEFHAFEDWQVHRYLAWGNSTPSRTPSSIVNGSYGRLPGKWETFDGSSLANEWIRLALGSLGCHPPEDGHFTAHSTRKGAATGARAEGTVLERVYFFGGWAQTFSVVHWYIDPTAVPDEYTEHLDGDGAFGCL
eukprot:gene4399-biopygen4339